MDERIKKVEESVGLRARQRRVTSAFAAVLLCGACGSGLAAGVGVADGRVFEARLTDALRPMQAMAQTAAKPRPTSTPYTGDLSIFEAPGRDERLQINRVMDLLGISAGSVVADIGAGSGWFSVRAAKRVGGTGVVLAEDINPQAIEAIEVRSKKEGLHNIKTVTGTPDDLKLPPASVDAALLLKVYHEIAHPVPVMRQLRASLKPGGRVGVIDRNGNGTDHGLERAILEREMHEAGFAVKARYDFTKADGQDYFVIFVAE